MCRPPSLSVILFTDGYTQSAYGHKLHAHTCTRHAHTHGVRSHTYDHVYVHESYMICRFLAIPLFHSLMCRPPMN